ncbi:FAD-dependent oxidoreductase [Mycolicibacterium phlei]
MAETTTCAIVGGGPAGMMAGLILARCGVDVTVMEKHGDFLRDFRGDTVHPSTMRLLHELGLLDTFDELPYSKLESVAFPVEGRPVTLIDFRRLREPHPFVAMVPQWDFLDMLADAGEAEPHFTLRMRTEVTGLLRDGGKVCGVRFTGPDGDGELRADLTIACDGRTSRVRAEAGLMPRQYPVPLDVWWFRVPRADDAVYTLIPRLGQGRALIMIPRVGYYQVGYLIPKGSDERLRARGLAALKAELATLVPEADLSTLTSWDDVKMLNVELNRLTTWYRDGLLCIGDAAHAMSPAGGVGVNVAIQDAAAAARLLYQPLREKRVTVRDLARVQRQRTLPVVVTQAFQRLIHARLLGPVLAGEVVSPPAALAEMFRRVPLLTRVPAYLVGVGLRSEHIPMVARR